MNLSKFQEINRIRSDRWHHGDSNAWSLLEWMGAACGEFGEGANFAKKIRRLDMSLPNKEAGIDKSNLDSLKVALGKEVADGIIYGLIVLDLLGLDSSELIANVFDQKSIEYGFPERAPRFR
jgi:hypothetical protein